MSSPDPQVHPALRELERVLRSELFKRSERLSRFLGFLVQRHIEGRACELKESVLGAEVFARKSDYNPKVDPIVRTEARRLRARLGEYYATDGKDDALVIEIPKAAMFLPFGSRRAPSADRSLVTGSPQRWLVS
jgi:hypothetical protein